ncbi:hypothetical protein AB1Y20_009997 [Prymnesium parvum]|uniref:Uncharacterized protein n=1 Tax=Prymnesium parvum TaxID=97485 RepID=A0AB34K348_PRYPA
MPCCSAPFVTVASKVNVEQSSLAPGEVARPQWTPNSHTISRKHAPPPISEEALEASRRRRDVLAEEAKKRYERWVEANPPLSPEERRQRQREPLRHGKDDQASFWQHRFREREREKEVGSEWASARRLATERERIEAAVSQASSTYLRHPPYPKHGSGIRNMEFSYMSSSYDYRMRQPSKEVAGTWPFMRTRPRSESARINEEVTHSTPVDGHAGGNWTLDPKYGNPASRSAQSIGNTFRAQSPRRWITATSPESKGKWRGSFVTSFPPSHAGHSSQPMGDAKPRWLLHEEPYIEQYHDVVAANISAAANRMRPRCRDKDISTTTFSNYLPTTFALPPVTRGTQNYYIESPADRISNTGELLTERSERSYHKYVDLASARSSNHSATPWCR